MQGWADEVKRLQIMRTNWGLLVLLSALFARSAAASIIVAQESWNDGSTAGWTSSQGWVNLSNPGSGGINDTGYLRATLDATTTGVGDPGAEWYALSKVDASSFFAGNWEGAWVEFDFLAENVAPAYVQIRWQSSTNSAVWRSTVFNSQKSGMSTGVWTRLGGPALSSSADWNYGGGTQEQFVNDLASIDWIGVYVFRGTADEQRYGLDDFRLMVPEPGETMMLGAALISAAFSLRRRLRKDPSGDAASSPSD